VVQDYLFPTVAYVGGPAEISYFAQVATLYQFYGRTMPVIWPRSSFTVIDPESRATLERYGLTFEDCFLGANPMARKIIEERHPEFETQFAQLRSLVNARIDELKPALATIDASLGPASETARRKLLHRADSLNARFLHFELRRNEALRNEVRRMLNASYPNENLQERELGFFSVQARIAYSLVEALLPLINPRDSFAHRIVS
jgi:uncharacterized protein YllA (UPF0747 family)